MFGATPAASLTRTTVEAWVRSERATRAPRRAEQALALLRRIYKHAIERGDADTNPADRVKASRRADAAPRHKTLTPDETTALIGACRTPRDRVLVLLLLDAGVRAGEARGLRWPCVLFAEHRLLIERAVWSGRGATRHVKAPKSNRARRVALTPRLMVALADLYAVGVIEKGGDASGWVLPGRGGQPLARKSAWQALARMADRAGIEDIDGKVLTGTHRLRHTSASAALRAGVAITTVAGQLGHASPRTTAQVYAHVIDDAQLDDYAQAIDGPATVQDGDKRLRDRLRGTAVAPDSA